MKRMLIVAAALVAALIIGVGAAYFGHAASVRQERSLVSSISSKECPVALVDRGRLTIRDNLKAPSTAVFDADSKPHLIYRLDRESGQHICAVTGSVDAQNSYGAMIRGSYSVHFKLTGEGRWSVLQFDVIGD